MTKSSSPFRKNRQAIVRSLGDYDVVVAGIINLLEQARHAAARVVNSIMTATYWEIGRRIVEFEQAGEMRAKYGEAVLPQLARDLTERFGKGFSLSNLKQMRGFYLAFPIAQKSQTVSGFFDQQSDISRMGAKASRRSGSAKSQTASGQLSLEREHPDFAAVTKVFPLTWSHYVRLLGCRSSEARSFYESEALRCGWSVRQLDRQISSQFYERTALSRNKVSMLTKGAKSISSAQMTPEEEIKDPFVLEFLGLKDEYSESDLEEALIHHLETFLLELGGDFAFIGRQRRLRIGDKWYRVDLVFYHRGLHCLVLIDLKVGELDHADAGQMHLYLNYAREHWMRDCENPPVGLILCAQKDAAVAHYALEGLPNKVIASEYRTVLPSEKRIAKEIKQAREIIETRAALSRHTAKRK